MKAVVMRTGVGIAIPLPGRLAEVLGLTPGMTVRVEGPDAEGTIRIVPVPDEAERPAAPPTPPRPPREPTPLPPTAMDVVRALSRTGPTAASGGDGEGITRELESLVDRHGDALREVDS